MANKAKPRVFAIKLIKHFGHRHPVYSYFAIKWRLRRDATRRGRRRAS